MLVLARIHIIGALAAARIASVSASSCSIWIDADVVCERKLANVDREGLRATLREETGGTVVTRLGDVLGVSKS